MLIYVRMHVWYKYVCVFSFFATLVTHTPGKSGIRLGLTCGDTFCLLCATHENAAFDFYEHTALTYSRYVCVISVDVCVCACVYYLLNMKMQIMLGKGEAS